MRLITPASFQSKLRKSEDSQTKFAVYSLSLAPHKLGGGKTVCPQSTRACESHCVGTIGLAAVFRSIMDSRIAKTQYLHERPGEFLSQLKSEIATAERTEERAGKRLAIRLNCFSDLPWESQKFGEIPQCFPRVTFYDYTKIVARAGKTPANYSLTFSHSGENNEDCLRLLASGYNVAVVFARRGHGYTGPRAVLQTEDLPKRYRLPGSEHNWECFDGDRNGDPAGQNRT